MAQSVGLYELCWTEHALDQLWERGISENRVLQMLSEQPRVYRNRNDDGTRRVIGPDGGGGFLTLIVALPDDLGRVRVITLWESSAAERTLHSRPGGTDHV